ncbi:MAG TPA: PilN domain-containing protein [Burkholderiales bacterium]|nr:PilN domain-containing protein [Burkholderiales bacterium]
MSEQINLYSPLFRKEEKVFAARAMTQALGGVLVAFIALYGYARYQVGVLSHETRESESQVQASLERAKKLSPVARADEKELDARIAELEPRVQAAEALLGTSTSATAGYTYVQALRALASQRLDGVWLTSIALSGDTGELSLIGKALRPELVPEYIDRLTREPALRGRQFATLSIERETPPKPAPEGDSNPLAAGVVFRLMASPQVEK